MQANPPLTSFLDTYRLSLSFLECKTLNFLILWSICCSFLSSTLRTVPIIWRGGQPRCSSFWTDFCYIVWFPVIFLHSWRALFKLFLSSLLIRWCMLPIFTSICKSLFFWTFWFYLDLIVLFLLSFAIFRFSLLARLIFLCQIKSLYNHSIFSMPVLRFSNSFSLSLFLLLVVVVLVYLVLVIGLSLESK